MAAGNGSTLPGGGELLQFPCEVDIKVFVRASENLDRRLHALLLQHLAPDQVLGIRRRESRKGNYHALSCLVVAREREELDRVYSVLSGHPDILMVI